MQGQPQQGKGSPAIHWNDDTNAWQPQPWQAGRRRPYNAQTGDEIEARLAGVAAPSDQPWQTSAGSNCMGGAGAGAYEGSWANYNAAARGEQSLPNANSWSSASWSEDLWDQSHPDHGSTNASTARIFAHRDKGKASMKGQGKPTSTHELRGKAPGARAAIAAAVQGVQQSWKGSSSSRGSWKGNGK